MSVLISFSSNIDKEKNILIAIENLAAHSEITVIKTIKFFTFKEAFEGFDNPDYYNAAVWAKTKLPPASYVK